jgi:hypothetical protein
MYSRRKRGKIEKMEDWGERERKGEREREKV